MKNHFIYLLLSAALFACNQKPTENNAQQPASEREADATVYQCPMHPHIVKDAAGACPVCEMDLEQKSYHEALMFLSDYKNEHADYHDGDELLKDLDHHQH
jgi:hypothetical protein